ncbi:VOC family protein [Fulvivirga lutea]|uniref:VOC family protein n=1 Tax=Fulvivirga lutea TaxID=2810512 RepID=A0A975A117_9BACT|nr:VOC family protein [Fulvivirga lutea]QSE97047.1 VOC family protein [Fulvivirga lutea]
MELESNVVGWFEVPVNDMPRAIKFYEKVFDFKIERHEMGELDMGWFPSNHKAGGAMGSLVKHPDFYTPSHEGPLVYFTAHSGDLNNELKRIEPAGGKVLMPKKLITEDIGYMAIFEDTEGNRVALHSRA